MSIVKRNLLILLCVLLNPSCSSELKEEGIIGTWRITNFNSNTNLSPALIASTKELAVTYVYRINKDYTFEQKDAYYSGSHFGVWELDLERSQIKFRFGGVEDKLESVYEISEFNEDEMQWIEDMKEFGQNTITLKRCDECDFENLYLYEKPELELLEELSISSEVLTDLYCNCMAEIKNREGCIEEYNTARFEIKILSDAAKEHFDIDNEHAPSNNKYTEHVRKLRESLVDCRNGFIDNN